MHLFKFQKATPLPLKFDLTEKQTTELLKSQNYEKI